MKPAYRLPTMAEVRATPKNGLFVLSTFSGCGGSCLGFKQAGFSTLWASEFVEAARDTYRKNFPDVPIDARDIRTVEPAEILTRIGREAGDVDVMEGSPPCASFSTAGKGYKLWGETKRYSDTSQRVDDLFFEYARILDGIRPRVFVAENVKGLQTGKSKGYYLKIKASLERCGYRVGAKVLDAQWLGVPQRRERLIFLGVREDLGIDPVFPKPWTYRYAVRDALPEIASYTLRNKFGQDFRFFSREVLPTVDTIGISAKNFYDLEVYERSGVHASEPRNFTIAELRTLCGFPADFELTGTFPQQWERLGRAVSPPMMKAIADTIAREVFHV